MTSVSENMEVEVQDKSTQMSSPLDSKSVITTTSALQFTKSKFWPTEEFSGEGQKFDSGSSNILSNEDNDEALETIAEDEPKGEAHSDQPSWANKIEYLLAPVALSMGLSTIWRFPYLCFHNGGGKPGDQESWTHVGVRSQRLVLQGL